MKYHNLVKILFLSAEPSDEARLRLGQELRDIRERLQLSKDRDKFFLESRESLRPGDITQALLDIEPQIVHFSGHGTKVGELCFEDAIGKAKPIQATALAKLFELVKENVDCVVLNACYSSIQAQVISEHIPFVIGMNQAIGDKAAVTFSVGFYKALGAGRLIDEAYRFGCAEIELNDIPEHLIPTLYIRKDKAVQSKVRWEIVLKASLSEIDEQQLEAIINSLKQISGDASLTVQKIEAGSVRIVFTGTKEGFNNIQSLLSSEQLTELLGFSIESLQEVTHNELTNNEITEQRQSFNRKGLISLDQRSAIEKTSVESLQDIPESYSGGITTLTAINTEQRDISSISFTLHPSIKSITKRFIDITGSLIGLIITALVFIPIAVAIKLDSSGPIFYTQTRCGLGGHLFKIWKFRSMVDGADSLKHLVNNEARGLIFKNMRDPRVTKVGRFLRRTGLDDLPQFWNILRGDMSIVGPRPRTIDEVMNYEPRHFRRLQVKPGITGDWQVDTRSKGTDFEEMLRLDLRYQEAWSILYDLKIISRTLLSIFVPS